MEIVRQWDLSALGTVGAALGDSTRFGIYEHVVGALEPVSASEVAAVFGLHRTVARSHLEKLAQAGLLTMGTRRNARGGRPAKVYAPAPSRLDIQVPPRRYQGLAGMLASLADRVHGDPTALARDVGYEIGREAAAGLSSDGHGGGDLAAVVAYLGAAGCSPRGERRPDGTVVLEVGNCVYREVAADHPAVVCSLGSGLLCGLLGANPAGHRLTASLLEGDPACVHEFAASA
jgi:predicted ArsR family transcriptional regulator